MQGGLRVISLQGAIEKSPLLLSQYWKFEWLDGTIIILYFGGSNNIFADCNDYLVIFANCSLWEMKVHFNVHNLFKINDWKNICC
jgi:hypothetical protein